MKRQFRQLDQETQREICERYAQAHNITIKEYFGGTFESAKSEGKLYQEMINKVARDREINVILVHSFDRFSRAGDEAIATKAYLKSKGIYVVSATQATDPDTAASELMENLLFPEGILWDKVKENYRTMKINKVFEVISLLPNIYNDKKRKKR